MSNARNKNAPLLIIDLEATCWENRTAPSGNPQSVWNMDIIELGCALATRDGNLLDSRSFLVKPSDSPELSGFCQALTGITQAMVDEAPAFPGASMMLEDWLGMPAGSFIWCSWGNYDRLHILADGEKHGRVPTFIESPHLNLKRLWRRTTGQKRKNGLAHALEYHGLSFEGHHHRGVDDARNMVRLLRYMDWSLESELLNYPNRST
ncbi:exonuclease [Marinobacter sp. R17]|uniref:3'-5' exonuclease n=1 Tax=Marinobacter sp. R17 TaxID=2484250 RepID=UPI000F4D0A24|nr:3'-5' exonuclease [Marinobacter sp. R17]ROT99903.1 exonuclease [Marinobacter sp. R17]